MSTEAHALSGNLSPFEQLGYARQIIQIESRALAQLANRLDGDFCHAVKLLHQCRGNVIVTGIGKAGVIGQKIMATLASTGTPSHWLHPAEAVHGDLGRIHRDDVVLILSQSGETEEILRLLPSLNELGLPILAITGQRDKHPGTGRLSDHRTGQPARGLRIGACSNHQHHGNAGHRRRPGPGNQPYAAFRPRRLRPISPRRQSGQ